MLEENENDLLLEDQNNLLLEDQNNNEFINVFQQRSDVRCRRRQRVNTGECNIMDNDSPTSVMEVD